jgi:hypothetical protein
MSYEQGKSATLQKGMFSLDPAFNHPTRMGAYPREDASDSAPPH